MEHVLYVHVTLYLILFIYFYKRYYYIDDKFLVGALPIGYKKNKTLYYYYYNIIF